MNKLFDSILPNKSDRIEGLDLLRSIAIICVVLYHAWAFMSPYFPQFKQLFFLGFWGVEFFFVLSGFLVGGIFIRSFYSNEKLGFNFLLQFWKRRWKRTIPIYLVVLITSYIFLNTYYKLNFDFPFRYFFFAQSLWFVHPRFFPEAWSLAVEEWFYLSLPIVFILFRFFLKEKSNKNVLFIIVCTVLLFSLPRLVFLSAPFDLTHWDNNIRKVVLYRLDSILYGVLAYQLIQMFYSQVKKIRYVLLLLGTVLLFLSYFIFYQKSFATYNNVFFISLTSLSIAICIPFFYFFKFKAEAFKSIVMLISVSSYSMYLIHYTIIFRVFNTGLITQNLVHAFGIFLLYLICVFFCSLLVHRFIEKPITKH
jgi:peptidoglycan/LPS O-acetylase OafA/YrhL